MKLLRKKSTGELFPFHPTLAARNDMEVIERGQPEPAAEQEAPATEEAATEPEDEAVVEENTSQNPDSASAEPAADPALNEALKSFRRQVGKGGKKAAEEDQPSGDA